MEVDAYLQCSNKFPRAFYTSRLDSTSCVVTVVPGVFYMVLQLEDVWHSVGKNRRLGLHYQHDIGDEHLNITIPTKAA